MFILEWLPGFAVRAFPLVALLVGATYLLMPKGKRTGAQEPREQEGMK